MDLQKGPEEGKRALSYQTTVAAREQDANSHDRYMASRMCQALVVACVALGIGVPVAQCAGSAVFMGTHAVGSAMVSGCFSIVLMMILGGVFRALAERIRMGGGNASVVVATVVGSLGALGSFALVVVGLIGLLAAGEAGAGLVATFSLGVFVFLYGKLVYHCFRVLGLRGRDGVEARREMSVSEGVARVSEYLQQPKYKRWAVLGVAVSLLVFNVIYVGIAGMWLRETLTMEPKAAFGVPVPVLPPAVSEEDLSLVQEYYDRGQGVPKKVREAVVDYCTVKWGITATQARVLDWALREQGQAVLGTGENTGDLPARIRGNATDVEGHWGPQISMTFPDGGLTLEHLGGGPIVWINAFRFHDDVVKKRAVGGDITRWAIGAIEREVREMRAENPKMTDAQFVAVCKRIRECERRDYNVLVAQGSYREIGGLLTVRMGEGRDKAFYVTEEGRVYETPPGDIAAEYLNAKKRWEAIVPHRKWELHWSGPAMILLDGLAGAALAVWIGMAGLANRSLKNVAAFKVWALALSCAASTWFFVFWCRSDPPVERLIFSVPLVAGVLLVLLVRTAEFFVVWKSTFHLVEVPKHTPFVKPRPLPLGVLLLVGVLIVAACVVGGVAIDLPKAGETPDISIVRAEPPAMGPSAKQVVEMVRSPDAEMRRRGVDEFLVCYPKPNYVSGMANEGYYREIQRMLSGLGKDYEELEPCQEKLLTAIGTSSSEAQQRLEQQFDFAWACRNPKARATYVYAHELIRRWEPKNLVQLEKLIASGMPVDGKEWGLGPLLNHALRGFNLVVVKLLLANKADPNLADPDGSSVFGIALENRMGLEVYRLLADGGADVNLVTPRGRGRSSGRPPLFFAASERRTEEVEFFLERGADPNAVFFSTTALDMVSRSRNPEAEKVRKLLLEHGAKTYKEIESSVKKAN